MTEKTITEFDYKGLNDPNLFDVFLKNAIAIEDGIRKTYIKRLQTFNKDNLEKNPEPFRFFKKDNCSLIFFILPYEFNLSFACQIFILSTPGKRVEEIHTLNYQDLIDLDTYMLYNSFFYDKILPLYNYHKSQIIMEISDYYPNIAYDSSVFSNSLNPENFINIHSLNSRILNLIKIETDTFQKVNHTPLSYFAKDAHKFPFSILDLRPLIELVNDDDFSYQLDQAMAAYHENLFLPCAATLCVVLETLCIKILEDNGINKIKSGDTQLGKLKERLSQENIISRRDNTRLEVAYKMRNMASHSSPGIALKEDCHFMLNVINTMAFEYLNNN
jgi:hypothetical protein